MSTKVIKSVILKKNEVFSLPAGAKVTSLIGGATSECATLPAAETLECYGIYYEIGDGENDVNEALLDNILIDGILIEGSEYLFTTPFFQNAASGDYSVPFKESIASNDFTKTTMFSACNNAATSQDGQGTLFIGIFKGPPSIYSNNVFFKASMQPGYGNLEGTGRLPFYLRVMKYADIVTKLGDNVNTVCPCTTTD